MVLCVLCILYGAWAMMLYAMLFCCTGVGEEVHCVFLGVYVTKWDS